jgi:antirestriction protein
MTTPRIYVACLASYNAGILHGAWIDANQDAESIHEDIRAMLERSLEPGAEEFAIHDYEGFAGLSLSEYEDIARVAEHAAMLEEHGEAWAAYVNHVGDHYATAEGFQDAYHGEYKSAEDFAYELAHEIGDVPEQWAPYIDWEKYARDLEYGGDFYFAENGYESVFVFWGNV